MPQKHTLESVLTVVGVVILLFASPAIGIELGRLLGIVTR